MVYYKGKHTVNGYTVVTYVAANTHSVALAWLGRWAEVMDDGSPGFFRFSQVRQEQFTRWDAAFTHTQENR